MQVALIDESQVGGDRRDGFTARQPALRFFESNVQMVRMQRQAEHLLELPRQLKSAHRRETRELIHRHRTIDMLMQIVPHSPQRRAIGDSSRRALCNPRPRPERKQRIVKRLLSRE